MANANTVIRLCTSKFAFVYYITMLIVTASVFCGIHEIVLSKAENQHCNWMKTKAEESRNSTPPWFSLLADYKATITTGRNMFVWHVGMKSSRLGNRLFNYAAIFGIAWRNQRIPIWPVYRLPSKKHDITKYFNLRIPLDPKNRITNVSTITYCNFKHNCCFELTF